MSRHFQDLLTAAKAVKNPTPALRKTIKAAEKHLNDPRRETILELARRTLAREGELEFDDDAIASEGNENGAYLQGWVWMDFSGTELEKEQSVGADGSGTVQHEKPSSSLARRRCGSGSPLRKIGPHQ
jgi:hypothetical protein